MTSQNVLASPSICLSVTERLGKENDEEWQRRIDTERQRYTKDRETERMIERYSNE